MAYTYLIGWTQHQKWYYGVRYAKGAKPTDLWNTYFTSSKHVKNFRSIHGEPDVIQIRKEFENVDHAREWESKVLRRIDATNNERFLNQTDNKSFSVEASLRGLETQRNMVIHPNKGKKNIAVSNLNKKKIGKFNPMFGKTGELAPCYGRTGDKHPMFGKKNPKASEVAKRTISCPHCNKVGNVANMKRWHFDNCKLNSYKEKQS